MKPRLKTLIQNRDRELRSANPRSRNRIRYRKQVLLMCSVLRKKQRRDGI